MFYVLPIMSNDLHANNFDPLEMLWNLYSSISVLFLCYATMLLSLSLIRCSLSDGVGLSFVMWARWSVRSKTAWEWMLACHPQTTKTTRMSNPVAEYLMYWSGSTTPLYYVDWHCLSKWSSDYYIVELFWSSEQFTITAINFWSIMSCSTTYISIVFHVWIIR